jgi:succinoglycan biosynthesis transport protein ExoP
MSRDTQGPSGSTLTLRPIGRTVSPKPARRGARGLLVARWPWLAVVTLIVVAVAAAVSWSRTPTYRATAEVLVQPRLFAAGTPPQAPDMGSEKAAAGSTVVLDIAARALGVPADQLDSGLSVSVPIETHVLRISYSSANADQARERAQAVATAYVSYWREQQPSLNTATGRTNRADILSTTVITPAKRPTSPSSPNHVIDIGIALIIGLLLAGGTAYLRDRLDDRLRGPDEFEDNSGAPVLGLVPAGGTKADPVVARIPGSPGAEAYRELRTMLLRVAEQRGAKALLITSPTGDAQTTVSANVAVALAQVGLRVVLVQADLRRPHGHELFGVKQVPGLGDVLEGRASLPDVLHQPEIPGPQVVPAGQLNGDVRTALHMSAWREVIRTLTSSADLVVIDGPAALAGADIATMLEVADMVLMVADARRTTRGQVRAAGAQLGHVSEKLIGGVLVNFGRRHRLVTPPLSLVVPGRGDHPRPLPRTTMRPNAARPNAAPPNAAPPNAAPPDDVEAEDYGEDEADDESARWLVPRSVDATSLPTKGVGNANGRERPATTGKV